MWKDFFYFSKRERTGILILILFVAGIFLGKYLFTPKALPPVEASVLEDKQEVMNPETNPEEVHPNSSSSPSYQKPYRPYQKKNNPPGNNPPEKRTYYQPEEKRREPPKSNNYPQLEKMQEGEVIDINSCDTTGLMKIPGIGASFAKRIVGYRNMLGGFYRVEQLQEVYGMYEELYVKITPYMTVDPVATRLIAANSASIEKLKSHPYINFYQAKAIVETRKKKGKLENLNELILMEEFTEDDLERIRPYLNFE
jgi:competence ComEA-like helix-hairpin-helix protein